MNIYRLAMVFTHGGESETYFPWLSQEPPSPREVTQNMQSQGAIRCWDHGPQGYAVGWIAWDPEDVSAIEVTETHLIISSEDGYPCDPTEVEPGPIEECPNCGYVPLKDGQPCSNCGWVVGFRLQTVDR